MRGIRRSPKRTSTASSAAPIARPSSLDSSTPALGRFRSRPSNPPRVSLKANTTSSASPPPIPTSRTANLAEKRTRRPELRTASCGRTGEDHENGNDPHCFRVHLEATLNRRRRPSRIPRPRQRLPSSHGPQSRRHHDRCRLAANLPSKKFPASSQLVAAPRPAPPPRRAVSSSTPSTTLPKSSDPRRIAILAPIRATAARASHCLLL